jgi:hypothetical protein
MVTFTSDVAGLADAAAGNASPRKELFRHMSRLLFRSALRALRENRVRAARRVIVTYAHLLPEGVKPADVLPFIASDQVHSGNAIARSLRED